MKLMSSLKSLGAAVVIGLSGIAAAPAMAQSSSLSDVLEAVRRDSSQLTADNEARLQDFQAARAEQANRLAALRAEVGQIQARANAFSAEFDANERRLGELQTQLETDAGDFSDLLGMFRTAAGETMPVLRRSLSNFDYPGRAEGLAEVAQARTLPTRQQLERLPKAILTEMVAQSEVKSFTATVANSGPNDSNASQEVFRVGVFTAAIVDGTRFVHVVATGDDDSKLVEYAVQPSSRFAGAMRNVINAGEGAVVRGTVDPSRGDLFKIFENLPTLADRFEAGGIVGYVIIGLLIVGLIIGLYKLVTLTLLGGAMKSTARTKQAGSGNALARVFEVYERNRNEDVETLELKLDEAILKESPKIERFNDIIKVLAAIAPLLGLLGTVIGMIITFTQITLYGAGDPQIMAGGISTALMTTVFGLVAAIPLILIHAVVSGSARGAQQVLDEQAAGLVAERAEQLGHRSTVS